MYCVIYIYIPACCNEPLVVLIPPPGRLTDLVVDVALSVRSCVYSKTSADCEGPSLFLAGFTNENKDFSNMYSLNI